VEGLLSSLGPSVAARSSVVGEDGAAASFAGLHATILNVTSAAALADAVRKIWESGRSEGAMAYRKHRAIAGPPRVAVVIQIMVHADRAGVMFTHNPMSGHDERVIEASWGLGEAIVAGLVTPDFYRMDRAGAVLEKRAGMKDRMIAFTPDGGTREIPVEPARQRALCLEAACLSRLHQLADGCEKAFGGARPHDIEWAFEGPALHLLQRRSVTAGGV
jgi:pyruvate, water dikinase